MLFNDNGQSISAPSQEFSVEECCNIMEQAIMDSCSPEEISAFLSDPAAVNEAIRQEIVTEKNIVRLDKKTKLSRAQKMAEFEIAKSKNDILFRKLLTVWKMERELEGQIHKKYGQQAKTLGKKNFNESLRKKRTGMSPAVRKATANAKKQFNGEIKVHGSKKPIKPVPVQIQAARV